MAAEQPPGVERDSDLHSRLETAYAAKPKDYVPRTKLMVDGRARFVNRLIDEASPYLLQHAHNPVDWHPWSQKTLEKAARLDRPIFLSVGYATCHWCHVMEEESFDNIEVAAVLNRYFVPVKVDREQMPALDHIFITATQLQQGHAGWPNSVFLLPDGRPFHTGTYFPRDAFLQVIGGIGPAWASGQRRDEIIAIADKLAIAIRDVTQMANAANVPLDDEVMARAVAALSANHNDLEGGFSLTQQFPQEGFLLFLLDHWRRTGDATALEILHTTVAAIVAGGIHDHAGGGFHRYTVDPNWRTPHFEKMLYNQALLGRVLVEMWEATRDPGYRRAALRTFAYVARDMTDADGAFFAAEDADSLDSDGEKVEGAFYVWTPEAVTVVAGDGAPEVLGLREPATIEAGAVIHFDPTGDIDLSVHDDLLETVRAARAARARPERDKKVIAGWNGLMIRAMAEGAHAFADPSLVQAAERAGKTIWDRLWDGEKLARFWAGGVVRGDGVLDDYAWLGLGYLALFDATGNAHWREKAIILADAMWVRFADDQGRLKMSAVDGPLGPVYDSADGALPSGESAALELLARLSHQVDTPQMDARARALRAALSGSLADQPLSRVNALVASRILDNGASTLHRTVGRGRVRVVMEPGRLVFDIAPGWHINAHSPGPDWLIGTSLGDVQADWPPGEAITADFSETPILVYSGRLEVEVSKVSGLVSLTIQTCSDTICLQPETVTFRLP